VALDQLVHTYLSEPTEKVIVWTSFVGNIGALLRRYSPYKPVALHGEMDTKSRNAAVAGFKNNAAVRMLIANPAAAREGLTLTRARTAIYVDRTFNLVDFLQSQDRIHRLSQAQPCEIVILNAAGTIDEFVDFTLAQKHRLARYTQGDTHAITDDDLELRKPDLVRALLAPQKRRVHP
jgi:SNF2 family DNA or RNA helicase